MFNLNISETVNSAVLAGFERCKQSKLTKCLIPNYINYNLQIIHYFTLDFTSDYFTPDFVVRWRCHR